MNWERCEAHTLGPIAVADPSRGLVARVWKAWTPDGYEVRLAGAIALLDAEEAARTEIGRAHV